MRVGIDCRSLLSVKTGIGVYTDRLVRELESDGDFAFTGYLPIPFLNPRKRKAALNEISQTHPHLKLITQTFPPPKIQRLIWAHSNLVPIESVIGGVDIFHSTSFVMPPLRRAKGVVTIYDLTFMITPEHHVKGIQGFAKQIHTYADRADSIIAISEHTKRDIVQHLKVPAERVRVTLLAADERYRVLDDAAGMDRILTKFGIDREYILYTGTLEPRKNVPTLIRAYAALKHEQKIPHRLVLAGKKGWLYDEIMESIRSLGLEKDVIFTGYVPDEDMPYLYNGASVFAYPSFYEGFGLPPLEAMACGCPVVTSNTSSLPEVVGDAGLMVDPNHPEELAEAMGRILGDSGLRMALREKGLLRAAGFSWRRCAEETLAVYRDVTGK